jgi:hypothetical protein
MLLAQVGQVMEIIQQDPNKSHMSVPEIEGTEHQFDGPLTLPSKSVVRESDFITDIYDLRCGELRCSNLFSTLIPPFVFTSSPLTTLPVSHHSLSLSIKTQLLTLHS